MRATEFVEKLKYVTTLKTTYLMGGFGCRLGLDWYNENYQWNKDHAAELKKKYNTDPITYGFDCVCYLKSILFWQFSGDPSKEFGGAKYSRKTDLTIQAMLDSCPDLTDKRWDEIEPGEFVWMEGHIGAYVGNGLCVEATPSWKSGVQLSALGNIGPVSGYPTRTWTKHGHSNYVTFETAETSETDQHAATLAALKAMVEKNGVLQEELNKTKADLTTAQNALRKAENALSESKVKLSEQTTRISYLGTLVSQKEKEAESLKSELEEQAKKCEKLQKEADQAKLEKEEAVAVQEAAKEEYKVALTYAENANKKLKNDLKDAQSELSKAKKEISELKEKLESENPGTGEETLVDVWHMFIRVITKRNK